MRFHPEKFSADIGVIDDGDGLGIRISRIPNCRALNTFLGIGHGMFESGRTQFQPLHARSQSGFIHHLEHDLDAFPLVAEKFTHALPVFAEV